jgi:hypothetical protein
MATHALASQSALRDSASQFGAWVLRSRGAQAVLLANLAPLAGAIWFGWDAFTVVFLYWLENIVIGGFNVLKMIFARADAPSYLEFYRRHPQMVVVTPLMVAFFIVHYGFFCYGHGVFVYVVFDQASGMENLPTWVQSDLTWGVAISLGALVAEHAYALYRDFYKRGDYQRTHPMLQMFLPYGRIVIVHCVLLFGAILVELLSLPTLIVAALLIVLKVGPELLAVRIGEAMRESATPA